MKVNNITFSPNFKAQFSNDKQTKNNLGAMINSSEDVKRVCNIVEQLEFVGNDTEISLSKQGYNVVATSSTTGNTVNLGNNYNNKPLYNLEKIVSDYENPCYQKLFGEESEFNLHIGDTFGTRVSKLAHADKYTRKNSQLEKQIAKLKIEKTKIENKIRDLHSEQTQNRKQQVNNERSAILSLLG